MRDALRSGGVAGLFHFVSTTGTLQPYSMVAAIGFALFGIVDWVPYAMNAWLVFSLLLFLEIARQRAGLPLRDWFLGAAVALSFPCSGYSVISFVGDHPGGLFLAIGAMAFLNGWPSSQSRLESWFGTLAWVFAFYSKGTLFPETLAVLLATAAIGCALAIRESREVRSPATLMRVWAIRALVVLPVVLPYYAIVARPLYNYLYINNYGAFRQIWAFRGSLSESLLFYLTGFSGEMMLGHALYLALALIAVRLVFLWSEDRLRQMRFLSVLAILLFTYALPTSMVNKTPYVGSPFQWLLVLTAVGCLFAILSRLRKRSAMVELLVAAAALLAFQFPQPLDRRGSPAVEARHRILDGLMTALEAQNVKQDEPVFLTTISYVSVNTLKYEFLKRRLPVPRFSDLALSGDPAQFRTRIDASDFGSQRTRATTRCSTRFLRHSFRLQPSPWSSRIRRSGKSRVSTLGGESTYYSIWAPGARENSVSPDGGHSCA